MAKFAVVLETQDTGKENCCQKGVTVIVVVVGLGLTPDPLDPIVSEKEAPVAERNQIAMRPFPPEAGVVMD